MSENSYVDHTYIAHEIAKEERDVDPWSRNSNAIDESGFSEILRNLQPTGNDINR